MNFSPQGIGVGLGAAFGLILIVRGLPFLRRQKLDERLAPYVRDSTMFVPGESSDRVFTPFPTLERLLRPYFGRGARILERMSGGGNSVRRRLRQAGLTMSLEEFRIEQLIWGALGFAAMLAIALMVLVSEGIGAISLLIMCVGAFLMGIMLRDRQLNSQIKKREKRMIAEFPTVADMLALSVTAGEGPVAALERVSTVSKGELAKEFRMALSEAQTGKTLVEALETIGERTNLGILARFVDGIAVAIERGTPLADVLRAQAADVREHSRRELIEAGGKKEIGMMFPIVFLILPITILFVFYPGWVSIEAF